MLVTGSRVIRDFAKRYPDATRALSAWAQVIGSNTFRNFSELKRAFSSVDVVGRVIVFDIRGNRYRLIATINLSLQACHVESILTHAEYDRRRWMKKLAVKEQALPAWRSPFPYDIPPIYDEADYDKALAVIEELAERGAVDDYHPENSILSRILLALHAYERIHHPWPITEDLAAVNL